MSVIASPRANFGSSVIASPRVNFGSYEDYLPGKDTALACLGGAASGALTGAGVGAVAGGVGAIPGAIVGGLLGCIGGGATVASHHGTPNANNGYVGDGYPGGGGGGNIGPFYTEPGSGLSTGAIVGIAAGGVGVLGLILILALKRRR